MWQDVIQIVIDRGLPLYEAIQPYYIFILAFVVTAVITNIILAIFKGRG